MLLLPARSIWRPRWQRMLMSHLQLKTGHLARTATNHLALCGGPPPECCDIIVPLSVDFTLAFVTSGGCCSDADAQFSGSYTTTTNLTCAFNWSKAASGATTCGTDGTDSWQVSTCGVTFNFYDTSSSMTPDLVYPGQFSTPYPPLFASVALTYTGTALQETFYYFRQGTCASTGAMSYEGYQLREYGGSPNYTPSVCSVSLTIDAINV